MLCMEKATDLAYPGVELEGVDDVGVRQVYAQHGFQWLQWDVGVVILCMQSLHHLKASSQMLRNHCNGVLL